MAKTLIYLNLNIEHGISPDCQTKGLLNVVGKAFFIALFDSRPLCTELLVVNELQKPIDFREILQPNGLFDAQALGNQSAKLWIALHKGSKISNGQESFWKTCLIKPPAGSDYSMIS